MKARLIRRETFSCAHRLHNKAMSVEENRELYGKCNNPNGHGHNYTLLVHILGEIDQSTGMIFNISDLKSIVKSVVQQVDHMHLDMDVEWFADRVSTTENLSVFFYQEIASKLPSTITLNKIELWETENNCVVYSGQ
ncbi:hypothetical protein MP228_011616 [Amoeboaphelidium protococcarum]|nr:hypothetical protein MP228_011616 [Amoeboaphelidium protococcarum]